LPGHSPILSVRRLFKFHVLRPGALPGIGRAPALVSEDQIGVGRDFLLA
jgi:hypothetical protein